MKTEELSIENKNKILEKLYAFKGDMSFSTNRVGQNIFIINPTVEIKNIKGIKLFYVPDTKYTKTRNEWILDFNYDSVTQLEKILKLGLDEVLQEAK